MRRSFSSFNFLPHRTIGTVSWQQDNIWENFLLNIFLFNAIFGIVLHTFSIKDWVINSYNLFDNIIYLICCHQTLIQVSHKAVTVQNRHKNTNLTTYNLTIITEHIFNLIRKLLHKIFLRFLHLIFRNLSTLLHITKCFIVIHIELTLRRFLFPF